MYNLECRFKATMRRRDRQCQCMEDFKHGPERWSRLQEVRPLACQEDAISTRWASSIECFFLSLLSHTFSTGVL